MRFLRFASTLFLAVALVSLPALPGKKKKASPEASDKKAKTLASLTEGAERYDGLFDIYRKDDGKLLLHVPADLLDAPLGFAAIRVSALGDFAMRGGALDRQLVRWRKTGDHLQLIKENLDFRADPESEMHGVLERTFLDSPAFAARLEKLEGDELVVDATKMFGPELAEILSRRSGFSVRDAGIVDHIKAFPDNVVVRIRYEAKRNEAGGGNDRDDRGGFGRFLRPGRIPDDRVAEVVVDYNLYRLPDDGFQPRFEDERIGGFVNGYKDYDGMDHKDSLFRHLLARWDVREPIVFYLDRSIPPRWRQAVREAAEWWNPAFEAIGVSPGVVVKDPEDEAWDAADIRNSVIYWNIADDLVFSGAAGPTLTDPRNGKVLKAHVYLNGEFFSFALNRYLVYAWWRAPDPESAGTMWTARRAAQEMTRQDDRICTRAASFSSQIAFARLVLQSRGVLQPGTAEADRFAREAFDELVAHEFGHALGFPHNWKASLVSTWDDVQRNEVTGRVQDNIFSSSVMDYNPIYLAPKGESQGDYFMRELGQYDLLSIEYMYKPLEHLSPAEQARELDRIAARAETEPGLIFDSGELGFADPTSNSDDIGDNPLAFAESRLKMLHEEVLPRLPELVLAEGHDYNLLRQALDSAIFSVALDYIDMTARHVGGQTLLRRVATSSAAASAGPPPITPLSARKQREALRILDEWVFRADRFSSITPEFMARLKADLRFDWNYAWRYASDYNVGARIAGLYEAALSTLLEPARLTRVMDNERRVQADADRFTLPELFATLTAMVFEFDVADRESIGADRRSLQRLYVRKLADMVLGRYRKGAPAEAAQLARHQLEGIKLGIEGLQAKEVKRDGYTAAHLGDLVAVIARALSAEVEAQS